MSKCKVCKEPYKKIYTSFQKTCPKISCIVEYGKSEGAKDNKRAITAERRAYKSNDKTHQKNLAITAFNRFIRERDVAEPCISCQKPLRPRYHAGHYKTAGGHPELRFEEINCHAQCPPCNSHLSGNIINYRMNLVRKIGVDAVEWIEGPHAVRKYTVESYKQITSKYKTKLKLLKEADSWQEIEGTKNLEALNS